MSEDKEVLFEKIGAAGLITLNRPKALNALTLGMCEDIIQQFNKWTRDSDISVMIIEGAGDKGFCAGGDIRALYDSGKAGTSLIADFYADEYLLNTMIKESEKPYVAILNGITMGGGVGVSVHGTYRVVTDNTMFAMPETGIGLFPDVGGTFFLPRCPGAVGMFMGLSGARLKAADCLYAGIGTHYVAQDTLEDLKVALGNTDASGVEAVLDKFASDPGEGKLAGQRELIDAHFENASVLQILASLDSDGGEWAQKEAATLRQKSPTSLCIAHEQLSRGKGLGFRECMKLEYRLTQRIMADKDFYEGVRAVIIDKDQSPKWSPSSIEDVTREEVLRHFDPLGDQELTL